MAYTYKCVRNGRTVYIGETKNPYRRNIEQSRTGKKYDYMQVTSGNISKPEARRRETRNLSSYRKATGRKPTYNKTSDGKFKKRNF